MAAPHPALLLQMRVPSQTTLLIIRSQTEFLPIPKFLFPVSPGNYLNKPITSFHRNEEQSSLLYNYHMDTSFFAIVLGIFFVCLLYEISYFLGHSSIFVHFLVLTEIILR